MATDPLNTSLVWVEDRCYRYYSDQINIDHSINIQNTDDPGNDCQDEGEFVDAKNNVDGKLIHKMKVPKTAIGFIMGKYHSNIKNIENTAKVKISITDDIINISSTNKKFLLVASNMIQLSIEKFKKISGPTHFISIPLHSVIFEEKYLNFIDIIKTKQYIKDRGMDEDLFQIPTRMHFTITMLTLLTEEEIHKCVALLDECISHFKEMNALHNLKIKLTGVEYMNDDPSEVNVLYAKIDPLYEDYDKLQSFVDCIHDRFVREGYIERSPIKGVGVKLHATVMNLKFRHNKDTASMNKRETFDAHNIIENLAQYDFGEIIADCIHLSRRFKYTKDGYYAPAHVFKLE